MKTRKKTLSLLGIVVFSFLTSGTTIQVPQSSYFNTATNRKNESAPPQTSASVNPTEVTPPFDTLSQTLSALFAAPLAQAIRQSRDRTYPRGKLMPTEIRRKLAPFFPRTILDKVRYSTDWETAADGTTYLLILQNSSVEAVTLGDVILFRDDQVVENPLLWAHELVHVEQYSRLGIPTFASQYLQQAWVLENEAITKADSIKGQLSP